MEPLSDTPTPQEQATTELMLALGQLLRRVRTEGNPNQLNLSQIAVMARLEQQGWLTTAELARIEAMKPQSMGAILAGLAQEGLVEHRPHPTDGRQKLFGLTAAGAAVRQTRVNAKRAWLLTAVGRLSADEVRTLLAAAPLIKRLAES
ncbi:MAG: MarR family transcriptional regulator [Paludibacterium sp.]|uniref:MarR family winged helix-turn-helix transcriptional regulator n=1 Tax=Paludibacterium sp. TaxID=1917523 RepID=UPI0025CB8ECE|nr:MarR family transcriptional regulator [Paludibacterium sp.]MBV8049344.1 MarR family transcriptional regulator [Paludibacterium sp.]MBV8649489.1 MarR family transcriptional regulator [Paludibacterium sp.]